MQNPFQQAGQAPAESQDPLAFVKKLWGDMQLPGMVTPNLSLDDLDKQIQDLKTVESWLTLNMNMLRGSIQALEVQRATIAALKTMGESFTKPANASTAAPSHASWPMPDNAQASNAAAFDPLLAENEEADEEDEASGSDAKPSEASAPPVNPAAWWTVLQDQFKQALQTAMRDHGADAAPATPKPATRPKAKKTTASLATAKKSSKTVKSKAKAGPAAARTKATAAKSKVMLLYTSMTLPLRSIKYL
ncbi:MAG: hypothetical protein HY253_07955 [Burkholderiales bacterium]|nr:hypothetical protein [Burkholderiales bacterium]